MWCEIPGILCQGFFAGDRPLGFGASYPGPGPTPSRFRSQARNPAPCRRSEVAKFRGSCASLSRWGWAWDVADSVPRCGHTRKRTRQSRKSSNRMPTELSLGPTFQNPSKDRSDRTVRALSEMVRQCQDLLTTRPPF